MAGPDFTSLLMGLQSLSHGDVASLTPGLKRLGLKVQEGTAPGVVRELLEKLPILRAEFDLLAIPVDMDALTVQVLDRTHSFSHDRSLLGLRHLAGVFLLTWFGLRHSEARRSADAAEHTRLRCAETCGRLVADNDIGDLLLSVHAGTSGPPAAWKDRVEAKALHFHRHGTTSIILRSTDSETALKLLHMPFTAIPAIIEASRNQYQMYGRLTVPAGGTGDLVDVIASADSWILMNFVDGITLAELMDEPMLLRLQSHSATSRSRSLVENLRREVEKHVDETWTKLALNGRDVELLMFDDLLDVARTMWLTQPAEGLQRLRERIASRVTVWGLRIRQRGIGRAEFPDPDTAIGRHWLDGYDVMRKSLAGSVDAAAREKALTIVSLATPGTRKKPEDLTPSEALVALQIMRRMERVDDSPLTALESIQNLDLLYEPLFSVLLQLKLAVPAAAHASGRGVVHGDLTPSNLIVKVTQPSMTMTVIDFGRNYLHTRALAGHQGTDAAYVAPEILNNRRADGLADHFSLGQLLIRVSGSSPDGDGTVPDLLYSGVPSIARYLEDLVQRDPDQRLTLLRDHPSQVPGMDVLRAKFGDEMFIVQDAIAHERSPDDSSAGVLLNDLRRPFAGAPQRQWTLWRRLRARRGRDAASSRTARSLAAWSLVSALAATVAFFTVVQATTLDHGMGWGTLTTQAAQKIAGRTDSDELAWWSSFWLGGYHVPAVNGDTNWPARIVCASYLLAGARYYQALFSGISPLQGTTWKEAGPRARVAVVAMRMETLVAPVLVLVVTLVSGPWWPVATALGQTFTFACNAGVILFVNASIRSARRRGISTVPLDDARIAGLQAYRGWTPSSVVYAAFTWVVTVLLAITWLRDVWFYTAAVAGLNIFLFYLVKCGSNAPTIRNALTRACLAAERVRVQRL
jgi:hypothetical protein